MNTIKQTPHKGSCSKRTRLTEREGRVAASMRDNLLKRKAQQSARMPAEQAAPDSEETL